MTGPGGGATPRQDVGHRFAPRRRLLLPAGLLLIGLCYLNGLGSTASSHIDESYYLVSGLTMVQSGSYLYPMYEGQPRFQKPILPYWAVSIAYRLFGPTLVAARTASLVAALLTIFLTYRLGRLLWGNQTAALLSALALAANVMFFTFARLCLTDMMLTLMMTAALHFFARWYFEEPHRPIFRSLAVLSMAVGVMVKGPLGVVIPLGTIGLFLAVRHGRAAPSMLAGFFSPGNLFLFLVVTLPWPLAMYHHFGDAYLDHVFLRETLGRVGITASSLATNALRYGWALVRYLFPWWLALIPLAAGAAGANRRTGREDDGGRTLLLRLNVVTVLVLLLFALKTYSFKYLLPLTPAFSLLVGAHLAEAGGVARAGQPLRAFHLGAALLMAAVGLAGLALFFAGLRFPEIANFWPLVLAAFSLAGIILVARLRSQGRHQWAAGSAAAIMLLLLSVVAGGILPLVRPDAVTTLAKAHLREALQPQDRIVTAGLDERKRAWLSVAAGRVVAPQSPDQPGTRRQRVPVRQGAGRTYLVAREEELNSLPIETRRTYDDVASAPEFRRMGLDSILKGLRRETPAAIPTRTIHLLVDRGSRASRDDRPGL